MGRPQGRRYVILGGGAVGGALVAQLVPAGHDVVLVARGEHGRLVGERGLVVRRPGRVDVVPVPVVSGPDDLELHPGDVLLLATKAQDAEAALGRWAWRPVVDAAGMEVGVAADLPVVTFQNGLVAEDLALRRWERVLGATIAIAASHLRPGEIVSPSLPPVAGLVWVGRHPAGRDAVQDELVEDLAGAGFAAWSVPDIGAHKAAKLLANVGNGLELLTGTAEDRQRARGLLRSEAERALAAAGIAVTAGGELPRHGVELRVLPVEGHIAGRHSTWQSFARGASSEVDHLNGEVALLARRHGVEAPLNVALQRLLGRTASGVPDPCPSLGDLLAATPGLAPA